MEEETCIDDGMDWMRPVISIPHRSEFLPYFLLPTPYSLPRHLTSAYSGYSLLACWRHSPAGGSNAEEEYGQRRQSRPPEDL